MDAAHQWTDEQLEGLERLLRAEYTQAAKEARSTLESMLKTYESEREQRLKALDNTPEAREAFDQWCRGQALQQARVASIAEQMSEAAVSANGRAIAAVREMIPVVYSENANRAAFDIDKMLGANTMFDLVDESTVREIMLSGASNSPIIREVPNPVHDRPKDYRWNRQKFTSAITQGILQGESIPNIVKRTSDIFGSNAAAAYRAARTATTGAENAGRISSYRRATDDLGIPMVEEWVATLDMRTRESHRALDGVQVEVGEAFHAEDGDLRYPGDPQGPASEVYNCRCTIRGRIKGFENARTERWSRLPEDMTYEEWKAGKAVSRSESYENEARNVGPQWYGAQASATSEQGGAGFVVDSMHPESVGGVQRTSESMTFDEANGLKGNPRHEIPEDVKRAYEDADRAMNEAWIGGGTTREQFDELVRARNEAANAYNAALAARQPYTVNCQTCVVANEARRRGYDVMATGNVRGSVNEMLSRDTRKAWIDPTTGRLPDYIKYSGSGTLDVQGKPIPTKSSYWRWLNSDGLIEEGNRYTIEFEWKGGSHSGHIVSLERVSGGLRLYDPQNGKVHMGDEVREYLERVKYSRASGGRRFAWGPEILRVDNMEFNPSIVDMILEARA